MNEPNLLPNLLLPLLLWVADESRCLLMALPAPIDRMSFRWLIII